MICCWAGLPRTPLAQLAFRPSHTTLGVRNELHYLVGLNRALRRAYDRAFDAYDVLIAIVADVVGRPQAHIRQHIVE